MARNTALLTKEKILHAAKKHFSCFGLKGVRLRSLCADADINVSMISHHFGGKEGLYQECLKEAGELFLGIAEDSLKEPSNLEEFRVRFELFCERILNAIVKDTDAYKMILRELDQVSPYFQKFLVPTYEEIYQRIDHFFAHAQTKGWIPKELEPRILTNFFHGVLSHQIIAENSKKLSPGRSIHLPEEQRRIINHMVKLFTYHSTSS